MQKSFIYSSQEENLPDDEVPDDMSSEKLQWFCRSVLKSSFSEFRDAEIEVRLYPYVGLTHTLRRRKSGWMLRISDHCRSAPSNVLESIVRILAYKVMRKKPPRRYVLAYEQFRKDPAIESAVKRRRVRKGRKQFSDKAGKHHSLKAIYKELNESFFNNQIEVNRIGWGLREGWDRLGHYDPIHHTITLSPVLDSADVPHYVLRYIVYHEMLHALFGDTPADGSRGHHPREYRTTEKAYPDYNRAQKFLKNFSRNRRSTK